ncbi:MAG: glycosyltransferase [Endomicrobia bacterium]|nr:glycosyltransferase [Endomicrobiia bacterium]
MRIILINKFLYPKGGAEISVFETGKIISQKAHRVYFWGMKHPENFYFPYSEYFVENVDYNKKLSLLEKIIISLNVLYSFEAKKKIEKFISEVAKPDIVHLNNFAHQISPSILDVFYKYKIPTVMTMRDYKLVCPIYTMLSKEEVCEKCKNGKYYWCFLKRCNKSSYSKSLINTIEMYLHHKFLHIYDKINIFISPSKFLAEKVKQMGFKRKIVILPNFVWVDEFLPEYSWQEDAICYFGRLSFEKGLNTLIDAIKGLSITLKIIGEGPLGESLKIKVRNENINNVKFLGHLTGDFLYNEIKKSMFVVLPSEWYENNPRSMLEAFALGKPVIGSRIGGIPELVIDNFTGLTFEPKNVEDLRSKIIYLVKNTDKIVEFGKNARKFVEENNNPNKHYQELVLIYSSILGYKNECNKKISLAMA